jgi:ABC-type transport system involved in multi-copper enzyme maturation permease subunit
MKNFGALYSFELKKILKTRLTVAMLIILLMTILIEAFTPGLFKGFDTTREEKAAMSRISGRTIDDALLQEMYPLLYENGTVWNAENMQYRGVLNTELSMVSDRDLLMGTSAEEMYRMREEKILDIMKEEGLSEREIAWWTEEAASVETPFTTMYYGGAIIYAQNLSGILLVILLIAALCLSTVFTQEHRQKTDQIILSCKYGRKETYLAKLAAGFSVILGCSLVSAGVLALLVQMLYGLDGLDAPVQLELAGSAYALTMGGFILRQLVVMIAAPILFAAFAMAVSELLKNPLAVMGLMVAVDIFGQLEVIPPSFRILAQINAMLPSNQISVWSLLEHRLIPLGNHFLTPFAASPIIYLLLSVILLLAGWNSYRRFQVTGR